jgi:hypothetical protein
MVRRTDRPLRKVRVSYETTRFAPQHLIDAYACLVPMVRRTSLTSAIVEPRQVTVMTVKKRRGEA